ncbi:hypothetical protein DB35_05055 [Streptomyces abyssalis]|uniref:Peptidoglycan recognition protein family domain-containing protein n=2 Tax=Streptomyces abyssalis TaxID=933944 RepID=A0A1E7JRF4_9ACTN|nr:hypothetical protein AN215_14130 [Streptomyces abyssalis]OEU95453.1 hypothetical protein DB35_05055 [Streptomyces abyssalis]
MTWEEPVRDALSPTAGRQRHGDPAEADTPPGPPRPDIVPRSAWNADESLVRERASTMRNVRVVFVHHTSQPNGYDCDAVPRMLRQLEAEHVERGWDDLGYNFVVDHCGTIYEGRSGALSRSVEGAHTKGFNAGSLGIAAMGTFDEGADVPQVMLDSIASLAAWKLGPRGDPHGKAELVSSSDESRFDEGDRARFDVITGHRDAFETSCPGMGLESRLGKIRDEAERLRKRAQARTPDRPPTEADGR